MSGDEFLELAGKLFAPLVTGQRAANEALFRTIVGRSYYGAFHLANEFLEQLGFPTSGHLNPPNYLQASNQPIAKRAGELLATLYEFRRRADYVLAGDRAIRDFTNIDFVRDQVERARSVKSLLEQCRVEPVKSQVRAGIEAYLRRVRELRTSS